MKKLLIAFFLLIAHKSFAQTLQQVTDNGNTTNKGISAKSFSAGGSSYAGAALPNSIFSLSGIQLNGDIPDASHNAITYQSGGGGGAAIGFYRGGAYDTGIDFYTNYNTPTHGHLNHVLRLNSQGRMGLGTSFPRANFDAARHLSDGELSSVLARLAEGDATGEGTYLGVKGYTTSILNGRSFSLEHGFYGQVNSSINFHRGNSVNGGFISFSTHSNSEKMRIDGEGNVGIGTAIPKEKLSVNGKIRAHEVKVETANWPDYVFKPDYEKMSLTELENFINTYGHLPEVPTAAEVDRDGIALGEMNRVLLKKIEELTLHLIEKDRQLVNQDQKIKNIEILLKKLIEK